jgi:NTP pyrophosphatase (non-canonical NTP hydrolase)
MGTEFDQKVSEVFAQLGQDVGDVNVANGWDTSRAMNANPSGYDAKWVVAHKIAELGLITTEVAEAIEEVRHGRAMNEVYYTGETNKPEGVPSELADSMIRIFDIADAYSIDLAAALLEKLAHNRTRGLHHGGKAL